MTPRTQQNPTHLGIWGTPLWCLIWAQIQFCSPWSAPCKSLLWATGRLSPHTYQPGQCLMSTIFNIQQLLDNIHLPPKKTLSPHSPKAAKYQLSKLLMYPPEFPVYPRHIWSKQIWGEYCFLLWFILQTFVIDGTVLIAGATVVCKDRHGDCSQRVHSLVRRKLTFIDVYSMPETTVNILTVFSPLSSQDYRVDIYFITKS